MQSSILPKIAYLNHPKEQRDIVTPSNKLSEKQFYSSTVPAGSHTVSCMYLYSNLSF